MWIGTVQIQSLSFCWNKGHLCCLCWWPYLLDQGHIGDQWLCNVIAWVRCGSQTSGRCRRFSWSHVGMRLRNSGLIKRIIEALRLDDGGKGKFTPSESNPLVRNVNGELANWAFSYISVVGVLLFCLDILSQHHFCCQLLCLLYVLPKTFAQVSSEMHSMLFEANWYGASLGGSLCNTSKT